MRKLCIPLAVAGMLLAMTASVRADDGEVRQEAQTRHYRLVLLIGPTEAVYTAAQARLERPSSGEIMLGGRVAGNIADVMPEAGGAPRVAARSTPDLHHLELHVYSRATGKTVPEAHVTIAVTDSDRTNHPVPVARMYGIDEGPDDLHFGNNINLPPGHYTIETAINGERARFAVMMPEGS